MAKQGYVGELRDGVHREGKGEFTWSTYGFKYTGEWGHGKPHGIGLLTFPDGGQYEVLRR